MTRPQVIPDPISCESGSKFYSRWAHLVEVYLMAITSNWLLRPVGD